MAKTGFDTTEFSKEMGRVFNEYRQLNKRALPYLLRNRAIQLAVGSGKNAKHKGLFQEALALRPAVQREIRGLPKKLNNRIRRPKGWTVEREIAARQVQAGRFQASGWIVPGFTDSTGEGSNVQTVRGRVSVNLSGDNPSITLTNTSPRAQEFGTRTGYISKAFYNQTQDMLEYIRTHLNMTVAEFKKARPNFKQPIKNFVPSS